MNNLGEIILRTKAINTENFKSLANIERIINRRKLEVKNQIIVDVLGIKKEPTKIEKVKKFFKEIFN